MVLLSPRLFPFSNGLPGHLVDKLNKLAVRLGENRTAINNFRRQLSIMRKPVQSIDFSTSL